MASYDEILKTEYSERFDDLRKKAMVTSFYKYGKASINYNQNYIDAIESLKLRLQKYEETGNTEFLVDVANFAMLEFMFPKNPKAHYKASDSDQSPGIVGMGINEIREFDNNN